MRSLNRVLLSLCCLSLSLLPVYEYASLKAHRCCYGGQQNIDPIMSFTGYNETEAQALVSS